MYLLHVSAECVPAAKAGGLADVVGALPSYLTQKGHKNQVIIPKHNTKWIATQQWQTISTSSIFMGGISHPYKIQKLASKELNYELLVVDMPSFYHRNGIYVNENQEPFRDSAERSIAFQIAVMQWLISNEELPNIIHCHDHHTGLIPFLIKYAFGFERLSKIPTIFTIHNGLYHGSFGWNKKWLLPRYDQSKDGLLDWGGQINPLASAIKNCWFYTTVSPGYLDELKYASGLNWLFENENGKALGVLNGIDTQRWDPKKDKLLTYKQEKNDLDSFKSNNKKALCEAYGLDDKLPLFVYIGRLMPEKGIEPIIHAIGSYLNRDNKANFIILGTGLVPLEDMAMNINEMYQNNVKAILAFDEKLAHNLYAGADFLLMPSFIEPCGLNQMYALRYGTVPIVSNIGGLKDSVIGLSESQDNGNGIKLYTIDLYTIWMAIEQAIALYEKPKEMNKVRQRASSVDMSWKKSAEIYLSIYEKVTNI